MNGSANVATNVLALYFQVNMSYARNLLSNDPISNDMNINMSYARNLLHDEINSISLKET